MNENVIPPCELDHDTLVIAKLLASYELLEASHAELLAALHTLTAVVGLTPLAGNKDALQEAFNIARAAIAKAKEVMP
ncbi:hypothetical protein UFOVP418_49 [uncultured Caudovirales phage]|uniref:Uncharacterized protein n=1 Tax=uncultured Caudovirales phage TaxID=2100421 RepID=A0A6J5M8Y0_9CAUD|nr:hypothetical protein UFOVP418_49 [uncultured Caudovirales phage]